LAQTTLSGPQRPLACASLENWFAPGTAARADGGSRDGVLVVVVVGVVGLAAAAGGGAGWVAGLAAAAGGVAGWVAALPRHCATKARSVIPWAWKAALLARHSSTQALTVFGWPCWPSAGTDTAKRPASAEHVSTAA